MKVTFRNRIAEEAHEMATGLLSIGAIDKTEMDEFDALCFMPAPKYDSTMIRELRNRLKLTQIALAAALNTSVSTVQKWEAGAKKPSGPSCKLLYLLDRNGLASLRVN
ncbi:MAG: helix-turn-helix domain-containing protein [Deltaproteobacteria bacterium]|nr:helix-turn-helix domain-containing protein [Deltaproteobacteria bacterium]MBR5705905.1 helix-turn-helix domain-containing protein [Deltaproteobacteria bacterium]